MVVTAEYVNIPAEVSPMRTYVVAPKTAGQYPGIVFYSDIFQLTGPMLRACARLAGYGFVVAAPEIYHRVEPAGTVIPFDDEGRTRGMRGAAATLVSEFDRDCRAVLDYLGKHAMVAPAKLGSAGFCIGGHLAFRAALQPDVRATVCFYPTGVHNGVLGKDADAGTLQRARDIRGEMLLVWGTLDPHIPEDGRKKIESVLKETGVRFSQKLYSAEHAFMRDEGHRYEPQATDQAWNEAITFFGRVFRQ